jgi:hypothetical protein
VTEEELLAEGGESPVGFAPGFCDLL